MPIELSTENLAKIRKLLSPLAGQKTLDTSELAVTLSSSPEAVQVVCVPDNRVVTGLSVSFDPISGDEPIFVTVSLSKLLDICKRSREPVVFTINEETSQVTTGVWAMPLEEERSLRTGDFENAGTVQAGDFYKALNAVKYAASPDFVRPGLTLIHFSNQFAKACDGYRYQEMRTGYDFEWDVSVYAASMLIQYLKMAFDQELDLCRTDKHLIYDFGDVRLVMPRPAVQFPKKIEDIIAKPAQANNTYVMSVDKGELRSAVEDVSIMADEKEPIVNFKVTRDEVHLMASDNSSNTAYRVIPCEWTGKEATFRFFVKAFLQLLNTSKSDQLDLRFGVSTLKHLTPAVVWEGDSFGLLNQVRSGRLQ